MFKTHIKNYGEAFYDLITYEGKFIWNERKCHKITLNIQIIEKLNIFQKVTKTYMILQKKR